MKVASESVLAKTLWNCPACHQPVEKGIKPRTAIKKERKPKQKKKIKKILIDYKELAKEYSKNNPLPKEKITNSSGRIVEWVCSACKHVWRQKVNKRTIRNYGVY